MIPRAAVIAAMADLVADQESTLLVVPHGWMIEVADGTTYLVENKTGDIRKFGPSISRARIFDAYETVVGEGELQRVTVEI